MNSTPFRGRVRRARRARLVPALLSALALLTLHGTGPRADAARKPKPKPATEGSLRAVGAGGASAGLCPLKETRVRAEVSGFVARVNVTQEFTNPFDEKIEAVYVFPLPQGAAVDDLTMRVGDRTIKGRVMRRAEARTTYEQAKERGQVASLLDQERPNVFTQSVANIMPGEDVTVTISYVELLKYEAGAYEWSFPMVVGERYIPAKSGRARRADPAARTSEGEGMTGGDTARADDANAAGETRRATAARLNPPRVPKGMRAGHEVSIEVALDAGVPLEGFASPTHQIEAAQQGASRAHVRLKELSAIPNKDFVLRYDVSGRKVEDAVLAHRSPSDPRGGFFTVILQPPDRVAPSEVVPKELVFVVDTSGSMEGFPLDKAKELVKLALDGLYPTDTFNLITFSGDEHLLFPEPRPATPENVKLAKKFLTEREGGGGTEMMAAVRAALDPTDSQAHVRVVCFLTDGHVGNDFEIISEVQKHPNARVFAMGFGDSPNRFLLDKMAEEGRGEVEYVSEEDDGSKAARRFHERVRNPLLTDITVEWRGLAVEQVYPERPPDLFGAKPVAITGRYLRGGAGSIVLKGRAAGREFAREIAVELPENSERNDALKSLWARLRVDDLMRHDYAGAQDDQVRDDLREQITQLGLDFRLMTQFTSFVAVDEASQTPAGAPLRVDVPAEQPSHLTPASGGALPNAYAGTAQVSGGGPGGGGGGSGPVIASGGYISNVQELVTVTSSAETVNTGSASSSTTVNARTISDLPLNGRQVVALSRLAPGVAAPAPRQPSAGREFSANGQRPTANEFTADGVDAGDVLPAGGVVSQEATAEFAVNSREIEGRSPGAHVGVVTRAGTNDLRGSLYEFFGHDRLDANDWFANSRGRPRAPHRLNLFGGTLGGPVRRDETFFFASYEGLRLSRPAFTVADVPSLGARLAAPPAVRPFLEAFPLPTGAARADGFAEFASAHTSPARLDSAALRVDQRLGDSAMLFARYAVGDAESRARGLEGFSANTLSALSRRSHLFTSSLDYTPNSDTHVNLRAGYSRFTSSRTNALDDFGGAAPPAFTDGNDNASANDPFFVFDLNGRGAALSRGGHAEDTRQRLQLAAQVSCVAGKHSPKFGADYRRAVVSFVRPPVEESVLFNGAAAALTGVAARAGLYARDEERSTAFHHVSLHAHDEWRKTKRLTLTYALRWELAPAPAARADETFTLAQSLDPLLLVEDARPWRTSFFNFAPRAGIAYLARKRDGRELVLRGGVGLFYDANALQSADAFGGALPLRSAAVAFDAPFASSFDDGAAATLGAGVVSSSSSSPGVPVAAFERGLALPYVWRWHATAQQSLGRSSTVTASYVGAAGRRLPFAETLVEPAPGLPLVRLTRGRAASDYHALQLQFDRRLADDLAASAAYTLSRSLDDAANDTPARALLRSASAGGERGPSDFDARHLLSAVVSYQVPSPFSSGAARALSRGWSLDAIFNARSARPVNVVYAVPVAYGFAFLRPDLIGGVPLYVSDATAAGGRRINPAAFAVPAPARQGTLGRNALRGFAFSQLDTALRRRFKLGEDTQLQIGMEAFNLLNRPNFADPEGAGLVTGGRLSPAGEFIPSGTFGRSLSLLGRGPTDDALEAFRSAGGPRTLRLLVKLEF